MSQFEFILIIVSIVAGITISEILASVSRSLSASQVSFRTGPYYLALFLILYSTTRYVWLLWDFRSMQWEFWNFMLVLSPVLTFAIAAHVQVVPRDCASLNLEEHYFAKARLFYILLALQAALWALADLANLSHISDVTTVKHFIPDRFGAAAAAVAGYFWLAYSRKLSLHWVILGSQYLYLFYASLRSLPTLSE